jgi:hypothetical protein
VAGRLEPSCLGELQELCRSIEGPFALELSGLLSADANGLEALRELEARGVELRGVSPFIRLLLANEQPGSVPG